jgi:hypothetical protein
MPQVVRSSQPDSSPGRMSRKRKGECGAVLCHAQGAARPPGVLEDAMGLLVEGLREQVAHGARFAAEEIAE